ncbi:MAG: hypothetical protein B6U85_08350 [Desulfurococcales archaeon ex4484_42]|nr:MAG: hypothetical protein B6U85_08350 [Desulfurococcales archaeon ex4484_42]
MSIDKKVLMYLKNNPGATPREIADALGISLNLVRALLRRLRESGYVMKSSRGGYVVRITKLHEESVEYRVEEGETIDTGKGSKSEVIVSDITRELRDLIKKLMSEIESLRERVGRIEYEINILKKSLQTSPNLRRHEAPSEVKVKGKEGTDDKLLEELKSRKVLSIEEAKSLTYKSLESYITQGYAVPISNYIVLKEFYEEVKKKFPIKVTEVKNLTNEERIVLDAMIKEGMVYLHGGREYRLIE